MTQPIDIDRRKVRVRPPGKDRHGRFGTVVDVAIDDNGWHGRYRVRTHGKSDAEVEAEIEAVKSRHTAKAARLESFRSLDREIRVGNRRFRIGHVSVIHAGGTDVALVVKVVDEDGLEVLRRRWVKPSADLLPPNEVFVAEIRAQLGQLVEAERAARADAQRLAAKLERV